MCKDEGVDQTPTFIWFPEYQTEGYKYIGVHEITQLLTFSLHGKFLKIYEDLERKENAIKESKGQGTRVVHDEL